MSIRNKLTFGNLLLLSAGAALLVALSVKGRQQWIIFAMALLAGFAFLKMGFHWAIHGTGYWPQGKVGALVTTAVVLLTPIILIAILRATPGFLKDFPQFWFPLPLPLPER